MPDLQFNNISNAAAARMIAVYRKIPAPDGTLPPDDATNTVLWARVKAVIGGFIRGMTKDLERDNPDTELDTIK